MEDINNNVNNGSVAPVIEIPPKENKTFKVLFVISILVVIGLLIVIYSLLKNPKELNVTKTNNEVEEAVTPTIEKSKTYKATSVQDDKNSISRLVLTDQDNNEIIVDESKYWEISDTLTAKPSYSDFLFSPDNNFLYYLNGSGWEATVSFLYDIKNKENIDLGFTVYSNEVMGFTLDSKYFYACAEGGMMSGGAVIKDLSSLINILSSSDGDSYKCEYNKDVGELTLSKLDTYNYVGEKILSQYKFSEKTGSLIKIK
jgi:hypothetical protein